MPRYVTTEEVAKMHHLRTRRSIAYALREGRLRGKKFGRVWMVLEADAKKFKVNEVSCANGRRNRGRAR